MALSGGTAHSLLWHLRPGPTFVDPLSAFRVDSVHSVAEFAGLTACLWNDVASQFFRVDGAGRGDRFAHSYATATRPWVLKDLRTKTKRNQTTLEAPTGPVGHLANLARMRLVGPWRIVTDMHFGPSFLHVAPAAQRLSGSVFGERCGHPLPLKGFLWDYEYLWDHPPVCPLKLI